MKYIYYLILPILFFASYSCEKDSDLYNQVDEPSLSLKGKWKNKKNKTRIETRCNSFSSKAKHFIDDLSGEFSMLCCCCCMNNVDEDDKKDEQEMKLRMNRMSQSCALHYQQKDLKYAYSKVKRSVYKGLDISNHKYYNEKGALVNCFSLTFDSKGKSDLLRCGKCHSFSIELMPLYIFISGDNSSEFQRVKCTDCEEIF